MASNGSLKLKSASLLDMYNTVHTYEEKRTGCVICAV